MIYKHALSHKIIIILLVMYSLVIGKVLILVLFYAFLKQLWSKCKVFSAQLL